MVMVAVMDDTATVQFPAEGPIDRSPGDPIDMIERHLDAAATLKGHHSFAPIEAAVTRIRQALVRDVRNLSTAQRDRLQKGVAVAHVMVAGRVGRMMRVPLSRMFGAVHFLVNTWASRPPGVSKPEGTLLQALSLAKALEAYLEYSRLWVEITQIDDEVMAARSKVFLGLLDAKGLHTGNSGKP
jgi:hypothetical protein